ALGGALLAIALGGAGALALARVEERWHRRSVLEHELARAASSESEPDQAAVDRIVGVADDRAVERLASVLDAIAADLRAAARDVLLAAKEPQPDEARSGAARLEGLDEALDRYLVLMDGETLDDASLALVRGAEGRLEDRAARDRP